MKHVMCLAIVVLCAAPALSQLAEPSQVGVTMGHVHLAVKDVDAQKQFWISVMDFRINAVVEQIRRLTASAGRTIGNIGAV